MAADPVRPERAVGRWQRLSLRARVTLTATALVTVALVAGAVALSFVVERALVAGVDSAARQRADDVALLAETGRLPDPIPVEAGTPLVQVVDDADRVLAASAGSDRLVPVLVPEEVAAVREGETRTVDGARLGLADPLHVVGRAVAGAEERTVLVAMSLGEARGSGQVLRVALAVVAPLLAGAFAVVCWLLVGRVLRPVAALTRGAAKITTTREAGRLPVSAAEDEIHRLAVTLNDMLDRLERSSARQRSFVADAAHELRSPLTAIRTQLEVGRAFPESTDWEHVTSEALADVDRLSRLVDDLLLLARLEDGPGPRTGAVDLAVVADEVVARASGPVRRVGHGSVPLHGDADALARVVANLVDNATRYARTGVTVEVIADGTHGRLVVSDDGPGISLADRERVFERFTRLDEARSRDAGGSGLGLAIVRELVRAHGGEVWLEDNEPGLRVVVRLPAAAAPGDPARHDGTQLGV